MRSVLLKYLQRFSLLGVLVGFLTVTWSIALSPVAMAVGATLYLSPGSATVTNGNNFTVSVRVSTSDQVNAVQANLSYPASQIDFVSIDASGSAFDVTAQSSGGNGSIQIGRGAFNPVSGDQLVANVVFKAKVSSGNAAISFASGSQVVRSSDNTDILGNTSGGNYNFTAPATPSSPAPSTSTTPKPSSSTPTPSPSPTPTQPQPTATSSSTPTPTQPTSVPLSAEHEGYLVAIKVVDDKNKPLKNAEVTLDNHKAKSDGSGVAGFLNISAGQHTVQVKARAGSTKSSIDVKPNPSTTELQEFTIKVVPSWLYRYLPFLIGGSALIVVGIFGLIGFRKWRQYQNDRHHFPDLNASANSKATVGTILPGEADASPVSQYPQPASIPPGSTIPPNPNVNSGT